MKHLTDRINNARERLRLFTRMIAIFETFQRNGKQILKFDRLVSMLPDIERRSVAGERLSLAMLSGIEDMVFPLMHRIVLKSIVSKWTGQEGENIDRYRIDGFRGLTPGRYAKLPLEKKPSYRQKKDETIIECGVRILLDNIDRLINKSAGAYSMEGSIELAKSAILELTQIEDPDHPVIVFEEDTDTESSDFGAAGEVAIYISLTRLAAVDITLADILKKIAKPGTQLTLIPHHLPNSTSILPQFPVAFDDGVGQENEMDDAHYAARSQEIFVPASNEFHPTLTRTRTTHEKFPYNLIDTVMSRSV